MSKFWDLKARGRGCSLLVNGKMGLQEGEANSRQATLCPLPYCLESLPPDASLALYLWLSAQMMPHFWGLPSPSHHKWVSPRPLLFSTLLCWNPLWQLWLFVMTHNYLYACLEPPSPPTCKLHGDGVLPQRCHSACTVLTCSFQNHRMKSDQESACPPAPWLDQLASQNSLAGLALL